MQNEFCPSLVVVLPICFPWGHDWATELNWIVVRAWVELWNFREDIHNTIDRSQLGLKEHGAHQTVLKIWGLPGKLSW